MLYMRDFLSQTVERIYHCSRTEQRQALDVTNEVHVHIYRSGAAVLPLPLTRDVFVH